MYPFCGCTHLRVRDSTEGSRIAHGSHIFAADAVQGRFEFVGLVRAHQTRVRLAERAVRYGRSLPAAMYRSYQS